jgi:hypothetical protein
MAIQPGLRITNLWTPAHIGTEGNEFADDAAKAATRLNPPESTPTSLITIRRYINNLILSRWYDAWAVVKTGRGLREIDDSAPSLKLVQIC